MGTVRALSWLVGPLALLASGVGLLWRPGSDPTGFTTARQQQVELSGGGLYHYDTVFVAAGQRGTDVVTLCLGIPLLVWVTARYRHGSVRGALLTTGTLGYFLYVYGSMALGTVAYNDLFLVYVLAAAASLYALVVAFRSVDVAELGQQVSANAPHRALGIFMLVSGLVTVVVWTTPIVAALVSGQVPERLDSYSTPVTTTLDVAVIAPAAVLAGLLLLRRNALGYLVAMSLLVLEAMLAPLLIAQTLSQLMAGVTFPTGQIMGPIVGFAAIGAAALWALTAILRNIEHSSGARTQGT
jgi:hypothetical protein